MKDQAAQRAVDVPDDLAPSQEGICSQAADISINIRQQESEQILQSTSKVDDVDMQEQPGEGASWPDPAPAETGND